MWFCLLAVRKQLPCVLCALLIAQLRQKLTSDCAHAMGTVIAFTDLRVGWWRDMRKLRWRWRWSRWGRQTLSGNSVFQSFQLTLQISAFTKELCQVRARDFDYFSTDFVRSVFVAYAHDSIWIPATRWMYLHGTSTFSTECEFPCKAPWFDAMK